MKVSTFLAGTLLALLLALWPHWAYASTAYGDLNNFDVVNDTGEECHGFEIEIEDVHSTDVTYTYDWNHYGAPRITEDNSDPAHPKVTIRYESTKNADGSWAAYTAVPAAPLTPTDGHMCTDPSVNEGCEHFGVGYYGAPSAIRYNWLVDRGGALVHHSSPVLVATPSWTYWPPVDVQPAVAIAVIPAPVVEIPPALEFGEPAFVKVIKTTTHNADDVALGDLISADVDGDGIDDWQNAEPAEVETEFKLLQANLGANPAKEELPGAEDDMGDGSETVTRRYEFYRYAAAANTIDGENGEAMCDEVDPTDDPNDPQYLHGIGTDVAVTDANGDKYFVDCSAQVVVGDYIGAQMAGFDAAMPLGLVDHLQDGEKDLAYTPRSLVVGGNSPYDLVVTGSLPAGLTLGDYTDPDSGQTLHGILHGTPTAGGIFNFTVEATDASAAVASNSYVLTVTGGIAPPAQYVLVVETFGAGSGNVAGGGIDCGATCDVLLDEGTEVTLTATADAGSVFSGWAGACAGTGDCVVTLNADTGVSATFVPTPTYTLTVSLTGSGNVTSTPSGIDCGATCDVVLDEGSEVTLTATPAAGSVFSGWAGACTGTGDCVVTLNADTAVSATFVPATLPYTLTVSRTGSGKVTSKPKGINCGTQCDHAFKVGTAVTLTATPAAGNVFSGWAGACTGTGACVVTLNADTTVSATFVPTPTYTLTVSHTGSGKVTSKPNGINCGNQCDHAFKEGTNVTLTAKPARKHQFLGWSGDCSGTLPTCTVPMLDVRNVTANFN